MFMKQEKCSYCDGTGGYCFPEAASVDMSDGWYKCDMCGGTGFKPVRGEEETMEGEKRESRELKYITLAASIDRIQGVKDHANVLLDKMRGGDLSNKESEKQPVLTKNQPSLEEFLQEGPDVATKACEDIHDILDRITDILF